MPTPRPSHPLKINLCDLEKLGSPKESLPFLLHATGTIFAGP